MTSPRLLFVACAALVVTAAPSHADEALRGIAVTAAETEWEPIQMYRRAVALVIGVSDYKDDRWDLDYARHDAEGVAATLRDFYSFDEVRTLYDEGATRAAVLDALFDLQDALTSDDALFIFYAGHGATRGQGDSQVAYLVPYDGSLDAEDRRAFSNNLSMATLKIEALEPMQARHVFLVADACYAGVLTKRGITVESPRRERAYLEAIVEPRMRIVLTAGADGQQVLDGGADGHSVFTGEFIAALREADSYTTGLELAGRVRMAVVEAAEARGHRQVPEYDRFEGSGGDFVFVVRQNEGELEAQAAALEKEAATLRDQGRMDELAAVEARQAQMALRRTALEAHKAQQAEALARRQERAEQTSENAAKRAELAQRDAAIREEKARLLADRASPSEKLAMAYELDGYVADLYSKTDAVLNARLERLDGRKTDFETNDDYSKRRAEAKVWREEVLPMNRRVVAAPVQPELAAMRGRPTSIPAEELSIEPGRYDTKQEWLPVTLRWKPPGQSKAAEAGVGFKLGASTASRLAGLMSAGAVVVSASIQPRFEGGRLSKLMLRDVRLTDPESGETWAGLSGSPLGRATKVKIQENGWLGLAGCRESRCLFADLGWGVQRLDWDGSRVEIGRFYGPDNSVAIATGPNDLWVAGVTKTRAWAGLRTTNDLLYDLKIKGLQPVGTSVAPDPENPVTQVNPERFGLAASQWIFESKKGQILEVVLAGGKVRLEPRATLPGLQAASRPDVRGRVVLRTESGELHLFDPADLSLRPIGETKLSGELGFDLSDDGTVLMLVDEGRIEMRRLESGQVKTAKLKYEAFAAALSPDGTLVALGLDAVVQILSLADLEPVGKYLTPSKSDNLPIRSVAWLDQGAAVAASASTAGGYFAPDIEQGWILPIGAMGAELRGWDRWKR
jgi:hypothetical protein